MLKIVRLALTTAVLVAVALRLRRRAREPGTLPGSRRAAPEKR
ncbi:hypothetical protein [Nonomuraea maritima]|nr:hypothetical protein [Nonomuraea maritima]